MQFIDVFFGSPNGGTRVELTGHGFGASEDDLVCVLAGEWRCTHVKWVSKIKIICYTPSVSEQALTDLRGNVTGDTGHC